MKKWIPQCIVSYAAPHWWVETTKDFVTTLAEADTTTEKEENKTV